MSLDKAIKSGKEWRNPKRKASSTCQNHGSCGYCRDGRLRKYRMRDQRDKELEQLDDQLELLEKLKQLPKVINDHVHLDSSLFYSNGDY